MTTLNKPFKSEIDKLIEFEINKALTIEKKRVCKIIKESWGHLDAFRGDDELKHRLYGGKDDINKS